MIRSLYADALALDQEKRKLYDGFKFLWYTDLKAFGRLPRSTDGLTNEFVTDGKGHHSLMPEFVVFFSYRWINQAPHITSPDDLDNTQYKRMIAALEDFLKLHPEMNPGKLGVWMVCPLHCSANITYSAVLTRSKKDFACIDQDNPASDVLALPLNLAQCNSIVTLADAEYESRAWCSVEALLADTLRNSYHQHTWYEQVLDGPAEDGHQAFRLQQGHMRLDTPMSKRRLRFEEEDRPKVVFLERQRHLLRND